MAGTALDWERAAAEVASFTGRPGWVEIEGLKTYLDGSLGSRTAFIDGPGGAEVSFDLRSKSDAASGAIDVGDLVGAQHHDRFEARGSRVVKGRAGPQPPPIRGV